jgi:hypothetical protein
MGDPDLPIHDSPCIIHGRTCDHTTEWATHYQAVFRTRVKRSWGQAEHHIFTGLISATLHESPWTLEATFDFRAWAAPHFDHSSKGRRTFRAALLRLRDAGVVALDFDPATCNRGRIGWNTDYAAWRPVDREAYRDLENRGLPPDGCISLAEFQAWLASRPAYDGPARYPQEAAKLWVFTRDAFTCVYCRQHTPAPACDHITPRIDGGSDHPDNLATACQPCNNSKWGYSPQEWLS